MTDDMVDKPVVEVFAAGGVIWRTTDAGVEVLVVHRPRYHDWSFPKGKRDHPDEPDEVCALREVAEETGLVCVLGAELDVCYYTDRRNRFKQVRYWAMTVDAAAAPHDADDEVDEMVWATPDAARRVLTYARDHPVLESFERIVVGGLH